MNENTEKMVATSANMKKPKKEEIQEIVKDLVERFPEETYKFAQIYSYFMPPVPKKVKTDFDWVAKAVMKKKDMTYPSQKRFTYVRVTETYIEATDTKRIHRVKNDAFLEPGFYLTNGDKTDLALDWPDTDIYFNEQHTEYHKIDTKTCKVIEIEIQKQKTGEMVPAYQITDTMYLNKKFVDEALNGETIGLFLTIDNESPVEILNFNYSNKKAIIMPMIR